MWCNMNKYEGYSWIKVPKYKIDLTKSWEDRYKELEKHHIAETTFLIDEVRGKNNNLSLADRAKEAACQAYCSYSKFRVGASVQCSDGRIFDGCNVENASYGLTICAERNALFAMIAAGGKKFSRLAIICADAHEHDSDHHKMPCGACRQVMTEFAAKDAVVEVVGVGKFTMEQLLPLAFV